MISIVNRTLFTTSATVGPTSATIPATTAGNTLLVMGIAPGANVVGQNPKLGAVTMAAPRSRWGSSICVLSSIAAGQTTVNWVGLGNVPSIALIYELTPCTADNNYDSLPTPAASEAGPTVTEPTSSAFFEVISQDAASGSYNSVSGPWVFDYQATSIPASGSGIGSVVYILNTSGSATPTWSVTNPGIHCGACAIGLLDAAAPVLGSCPTQITGGNFMDALGNRLAYGYLRMQLTIDTLTCTHNGQVVAGRSIKVPLDKNGNIAGTVNVEGNDLLLPAGSQYLVQAYFADGRQAWAAPHLWTIQSFPTVDIGTLAPS